MKNFSAQDLANQEFSLIEFRSELEALKLINELPNDVKLMDMFSLMNGHFVVLLTCINLKKTFDFLMTSPAAIDGYFTSDTNVESLHAFYYLNKITIGEGLIAVKTNKITAVFKVMNAAHKCHVGVLDHKNQRSFPENTLYLTGSRDNILKLSEDLQKLKNIEFQILPKMNDVLLKALSLT